MADISFLIRTCNSEKTIWKCLKSIRDQIAPPGLETEIVVIDNESSDSTVEKAKSLAKQVVAFTEVRPTGIYTPGAALNAGMEVATGDMVIILSSHCVAADRHLLNAFFSTLVQYQSFCNKRMVPLDIGGMYGRQIPGSKLKPHEKIELYTVFGPGTEAIINSENPFFHNGCSCILRTAWRNCPFNEKLDTLEDREWAYRIQQLAKGKVMYVPGAIVTRHKPLFHPEHAKEALQLIERTLEPVEIQNVKGNA